LKKYLLINGKKPLQKLCFIHLFLPGGAQNGNPLTGCQTERSRNLKRPLQRFLYFLPKIQNLTKKENPREFSFLNNKIDYW